MTRRIIHRVRGGAGGSGLVCSARAGGHEYGQWRGCACELKATAHAQSRDRCGVGGSCGWEYRRCRCCPGWQERRALRPDTSAARVGARCPNESLVGGERR